MKENQSFVVVITHFQCTINNKCFVIATGTGKEPSFISGSGKNTWKQFGFNGT